MVDTTSLGGIAASSFPEQTPTPAESLNNQLGLIQQTYNDLLDKYGVASGGPNVNVIRSLNQGIQQKNTEYKKNTASVENMYGQLTQESDAAKQSLLAAYEQAIGASKEGTAALQKSFSGEIGAQEARRASMAAELGLSAENALTPSLNQERLNLAMANIMGSGQSWQNLLQSQKLSAQEQADRMRVAIGNTKASTKLALSEAYQNAVNNYKAQIAGEQSKVATKDFGDPFTAARGAALVEDYKALLNPTDSKAVSEDKTKFEQLGNLIGKKVEGGYNSPEFAALLAKAQLAIWAPQNAGVETSPQLTRFIQIFGLNKTNVPAPTTQAALGQITGSSDMGWMNRGTAPLN